jgi:hypothetical protein
MPKHKVLRWAWLGALLFGTSTEAQHGVERTETYEASQDKYSRENQKYNP